MASNGTTQLGGFGTVGAGGLTGFPIGNRSAWIQSQLQQPAAAGNRYGSGARSATGNRRPRSSTPSRRRERSRDQSLMEMEQDFRTQPAGPQERADWLEALESTENRLESMERLQRMQGQTIAHMEEQRQVLQARMESAAVSHSKEVRDRFDNVHARLNEGNENWKMKFIEYDGKFAELEQIIAIRDSRLELLTGLVNQLKSTAESQVYVPSYAISTPTGAGLQQQAPAPVNRGAFAAFATTAEQPGPFGPNVEPVPPAQEFNPPQMPENPFGMHGPGQMPSAPMHSAQMGQQFADQRAQMAQPLLETPPLQPHQPPQMPGSWGQARPVVPNHGAPQMAYGAPQMAHCAPQMAQSPFSPIGQGHLNSLQQQYIQCNAAHGGKSISFEISRKRNETLKTFNASIDEYEMWHDRMVDHICMNNAMWRNVLEYIEKQPVVCTRAITQTLDVLGVNAWDLSVMLENFLCYWVSDKIYKKRKHHSGGEAGNGFEMWRRFFKGFQGGGVTVKLAGINALNTFPKCSSAANLGSHLDSWQELYDEFGDALGNDALQLFSKLRDTLPDTTIQDLLDHPEVHDYQTLMAYCRRRTDFKKEQELIAFAKKKIVNRTRMHTMLATGQQEAAPETAHAKSDWRNEQVSAGDVDAMIVAAMSRDTSRGRVRARTPPRDKRPSSRERVRFVWDGSCWHCRSKDHQRDKCEAYLKILETNGGKAPEGYVSAFNKAKKAWQANKPVVKKTGDKKAHSKALQEGQIEEEHFNTEDEGSDSSSDEMGFAMVVAKDIKPTLRSTKVHRPVSVTQTSNTFLPLSADDASSHEIPSSSMMNQLNSWAHKVKVRGSASRHGVRPSTRVSRSAAQNLPVISSEKDLDKALKAHPHLLSAMPTDRKRIAKASKMTPDRLMLREGEMWAMMDSGAGVPGINVVKH